MNGNKNSSIECTVDSCKHHCQSQNYCSLTSIMVGSHECNPTTEECTDCMSFEIGK